MGNAMNADTEDSNAVSVRGAVPPCSGAAFARAFPRGMLVGVNYWGSKAGVRMWRADEWDEVSVERDVAALAAHGVELMRVFPTWSEFQPLMRCRKVQGKSGTILREGTDEEIFDPLWLDPGALARFGRLCDFA